MAEVRHLAGLSVFSASAVLVAPGVIGVIDEGSSTVRNCGHQGQVGLTSDSLWADDGRMATGRKVMDGWGH